MKWMQWVVIAVVFALSTGFFKKDDLNKMVSEGEAPEAVEASVAVTNEVKQVTAEETEISSVADVAKDMAIDAATEVVMSEIEKNLGLSMDAVKEKVNALDKDELMKYVDGYKALIETKKMELTDLKEEVKKASWMKRAGMAAKCAEYAEEIDTLVAQSQIYYEQLKALGGL